MEQIWVSPQKIDILCASSWPSALYHLIDRGDERQAIFGDDRDLRHLLRCLEGVVERFGLLVYLKRPCVFEDVVETKLVYLAQG